MVNQMKKVHILIIITFLTAGLLGACSKQESVDIEYPVIDLTVSGAFPQQCSELTRGQRISFKARFSDNVALGSYSLDVHHNFDHHSHSTELLSCTMEADKAPVKPFLMIRNFTIPENLKEYEAIAELEIPADIDSGDYHFLIRLTDKEGWQTLKGLSIKIK